MAEIIISAIMLVLSAAAPYVQELHINRGNEIKSKVEDLAKKIYSKMGNNSLFIDKLKEAYSSKNTSLVNALFTQAGFSPAISAIRTRIKDIRDKYQSKLSEATKDNTELQNQYNKLTNAGYQTGTIAGNKYARETYNQVGQAVEGGLSDYKHEDIQPNILPTINIKNNK